MSRKSKKQSVQGTYALCVTVGLFVGLGLGPAFGSVTLTALLGALLGGGAGYWFTHLRHQNKKHK